MATSADPTGRLFASIPKLANDGGNFMLWKYRVREILEARRLLDYVTGDNIQTEPSTGDVYRGDWITRNREARQQITLTLEDDPLLGVMHLDNAAAIWEALCTRYEGTGVQAISYLMSKIWREQFNDTSDLQTQINELRASALKLKNLGFDLPDNILAIAILLSLPPSYANLQTSIGVAGDDKLSSHKVTTLILAEQQRRRETGEAAFRARAVKSNGGKDAKDGKKYKKCTNCKRLGHTVERCYSKGGGMEGQGPPKRDDKRDDKAKVAETSNQSNTTDSKPIALFMASVDDDDNGSESDDEHVELHVANRLVKPKYRQGWIVDSGASMHMSSHRDWFTTYREIHPPRRVWLGDHRYIEAVGEGRIMVEMAVGNGRTISGVFQSVLHVPDLNGNLLSVRQLGRSGCSTQFTANECIIRNSENEVVGLAPIDGNLYTLQVSVYAEERVCISTVNTSSQYGLAIGSLSSRASIEIWHRRLGHIHYDSIRHMVNKDLVRGMEIPPDSKEPSAICSPCVEGKHVRTPIPKETSMRADTVLGRIFSDIWGPAPILTPSNERYYALFIDDKSRRISVSLIKHKSDTFAEYKSFVARAENETGRHVVALRTDGGGEYSSKEFQTYLKEKGQKHELTNPDTPPENGVAERANGYIMGHARSLLQDAGLPKAFWGHAVQHAVHIHNITPSRALPGSITPHEAYFGQKPTLSLLRVFGCKAHVQIPAKLRDKLGARSMECIYLGYSESKKAYRVYNRQSKRFFESRDVIFDEGTGVTEHVEIEVGSLVEGGENNVHTDNDQKMNPGNKVMDSPALKSSTTTPPSQLSTHSLPNKEPVLRRSGRTVIKPLRDDENPKLTLTSYNRPNSMPKSSSPTDTVSVGDEHAKLAMPHEPSSYKQAMALPEADHWMEACIYEMDALAKNKTFKWVEKPADRQTVGSRWVFKIKRDSSGDITGYRARVVAKGYTEVPGVDFFETYAPTIRKQSFLVILALAAKHDLELVHFDVKSAFLNPVLKELIYMDAPNGFTPPKPGMVWQLLRSLYGLKQAAREWYLEMRNEFGKVGWKRTESDYAVFTQRDKNGLAILGAHVDDIMLAVPKPSLPTRKDDLLGTFDMRYMGDLHWYTGIKIIRDRNRHTITISQDSYTRDILERFSMADARPATTPMATKLKLDKLDVPATDVQFYQSMLGSVMYAMIGTRPDLAFAVGYLSRHASTPGPEHLTALKRIYRYLVKTAAASLTFDGSKSDILHGFTDSDWAGDPADRRSITGTLWLLCGAPVGWTSRKQSSVVISSTEAEYIAATQGARDAIWFRNLLSDLGHPMISPTTIHIDNQSAIAIAQNERFSERTKHFEVGHHFVREKLEDGIISLEYIPTDKQPADILTKPLAADKFRTFTDMMGFNGIR
jgi:Reverse transcriptase (RNA-dependent DNA polymerase)/Pol polyprotein, beta-barrel domain/gag-polypeptide of LTR copia-type/GAG-pre-integrase domain